MSDMVTSSIRIGTGSLNDLARTAAIREKTKWHITIGRASCALNECRNCRNFQIQGNAGTRFSSRQMVCLITAAPTKKRATCVMFQPGAIRLYEEVVP